MFVSGENSNRQLFENESNDGFFGDQCISPPKKVDFDISKIKSFSSYSDHSVWINNDGNAFAIGNNNRSQINSSSQGKIYEKPTKLKIDGFTPSEQEYFVSVVCGDNYTLYMTSSDRLIYVHEKGQGKPLILKLKIPNPKFNSKSSKSSDKYIYRKPLGLFGGCSRAAVIDEEGDFYIFSEELFNSKNQTPKHYSLPESVTYIACCDTFLVALTSSGKVYGNGQINDNDDEFVRVEELSEFGPFTQISGTYDHCLALNDKGSVYGFGSNYKGRLSLDSEIRTVNTFVLLSVFDDIKVYGISAGFNHSLFLMKGTELASCGTNSYGELLAIKPTKDCYFTPIKTSIKAESKIPYFIAGYNTSFAFVDCEAPPNCPNQNVDLTKKRIKSEKTESNSPSELTSSARKKIEDSKSNQSKKYTSNNSNDDNTNENTNSESVNKNSSKPQTNANNNTEIKALKDKVTELTSALEKSEEEKAIVIKKLLEISQIADQLHNANKDLAAKVIKYELALGLLAAVANASSESSEAEEEEENENEKKELKEKEEREKKEKEEREKKEKEEREKKEKEKKLKEEKEKKLKEEKEKKLKEEREKKLKEEREKKAREEKERKEKERQLRKKQQQESKQKSENEETAQSQQRKQEDDQKQQKKNQQQDSKQKSQEVENKQKQQKKQAEQKQKSSEAEAKQKQQRKQEDEQKQQRKHEDEQKQQRKQEDEQKQQRKQEDEQKQQADDQKQQKKNQQQSKQKSQENENKQKQYQASQKVCQTDNQEQQSRDDSEESSKQHRHRHHRHNKEKQQNQEQQSQNQEQKQKPKEPSGNEDNQEQKYAPRRRHRRERQENNNDTDEQANNAKKISTPPSLLAQKENEQKKTIIRPTKSKK